MPTIYSNTGTSLNVDDPATLKSFLSNGNWSTQAPVPKSAIPAPTSAAVSAPVSASSAPPSSPSFGMPPMSSGMGGSSGIFGAAAGLPTGVVPAPKPSSPSSPSVTSPSVPMPSAPAGIPGAALGGAVGMGMFDGPKGSAGVPSSIIPAPQSSGGFITPQKASSAPVSALSASPTPAMPQTSVPAPQSTYGQLSPDQIKAEAQARIDAQRAALQQSVDATKRGLKNTYDYNNQLLHDNRVLEDQTFKRNNSPFTGQTDYLTAQLLRNRGIQDTAAQKDYTSAVAAADQKLNDFNALAPEQQQSIVNDLTRIERQYGLDAGQLTGMFNGAPTLAAQGQAAQYTGMYGGQPTLQAQNQAFQQQIAAAGLTGQFGGQMTLPAQVQLAELYGQNPYNGQSTLAGKQANLNAAIQVGQQRGQVIGPQSDWGNLFTEQGAPSFAAQQAQQQNAIARAQALGVVDNPQDAAILGVPVGTSTREMQALMNDMAYKNAQLGLSAERNSIAAERAGNTQGMNQARERYYNAQADKASQPSANKNDVEASYVGNIDQMTPENRVTFFKNEKANIVKDLGLPGYQALLSQYNSDGTPVAPGMKPY